jgi:hypothetical protein
LATYSVNTLQSVKLVMKARESSIFSMPSTEKSQTPTNDRQTAKFEYVAEYSQGMQNLEEGSSKPQSLRLLQVPSEPKKEQQPDNQSAENQSMKSQPSKDRSFMDQTGFSKSAMKKKVIQAAAEVVKCPDPSATHLS